ncbi:MAG: hypothetical protein AAF501_10145 [Pseudomonadota bacterium]
MRSVIVHYHCYKNAGSTVDRSVTTSFGRDALMEVDKHELYREVKAYNRAFFEEVIPKHPDVICFSSHRTVPSAHLISDHNVIPVLFLRHPLLRVASAYRFEAKRQDGPQFEDARRLSFRDWLRSRVEDVNGWEARNYQSCIFSLKEDGQPDLVPGSTTRQVHFDRLWARMNALPVVGVVEEFERSTTAYNALIGTQIPGFALGGAANRTKESSDWKADVADLESEIGPEVAALFRQGNEQDYALFEHFVEKIASGSGG